MAEHNRNILEKYIGIAKGLQAYLGSCSEFIIHDISVPESSIVFIAGDLTHRSIGGPITNVVMEALKQYGNFAKDMIGYRSVTRDGRELKSATIFIRDDNDIIVGCMCMNMDLSVFWEFEQVLSDLTACPLDEPSRSDNSSEVFAQDISEVVESIVKTELAVIPKPASSYGRCDKLDFITRLESRGVFEVKGATEYVAQTLGVSVFTVYNYIKEIRHHS